MLANSMHALKSGGADGLLASRAQADTTTLTHMLGGPGALGKCGLIFENFLEGDVGP